MNYTFSEFDLIRNPKSTFYKVLIDGHCQFDEFVARLDKLKSERKSFDNLMAWLENFDCQTMYPKEKLNIIKGVSRNDVREFKKNTIRIYVIIKERNVYIFRGGLKNEQERDIKLLDSETKIFPIV